MPIDQDYDDDDAGDDGHSAPIRVYMHERQRGDQIAQMHPRFRPRWRAPDEVFADILRIRRLDLNFDEGPEDW